MFTKNQASEAEELNLRQKGQRGDKFRGHFATRRQQSEKYTKATTIQVGTFVKTTQKTNNTTLNTNRNSRFAFNFNALYLAYQCRKWAGSSPLLLRRTLFMSLIRSPLMSSIDSKTNH